MKINVLGLGETLQLYKKDENITIGVNDIQGRLKTDYVICLDQPSVFSAERLSAIEGSDCLGFYSQIEYWKKIENFQKITFHNSRGAIDL